MNSTGEPIFEAVPEGPQSPDPPDENPYHGHLDQILDRFERHARRAFADCSEEAIHELRVDYKMLRATLAPLKSADPSDPVRAAARPFRRLFRAAGPLRECHVHRGLLTKYMEQQELLLPEWIHELTAREMSARRRFLRLLPPEPPAEGPSLAQVVREATSSLDAAELEWRAASLFAVAASRLADVQQERDLDAVDLHRVRRLAKDARYVLGLVNAVSRTSDPGQKDLDASLREVHRALGVWHDATVADQDLQAFLDKRGDKPLRHPELYAAYRERLGSCARRQREKFGGHWQHLLVVLGVTAA